MLQLRTFGAVALYRQTHGGSKSVAVQPKRLALLIYLARGEPGAFLRRDALLAAFWPESTTERARTALRQALTGLRRGLGDGVLITRGEEEVAVSPAALTCDATEVERACARGDGAAALALCRGDFLEGFHVDGSANLEEWISAERARFRQLAVRAAWMAADAAERSDPPTAVHYARRAAALAPDDEVGLVRCLALLDRCGDRAGALHAYDLFRRRLAEQYGAEPAPETQALVAALRSRPPDELASSGLTDPAAALDSPAPARHPGPTPSPPIRRPIRWVAGLAGALAVVSLAGLMVSRSPLDRGPAMDPMSIAVLPLAAPDTSLEYLAVGLTDGLVERLARIARLHLTAQSVVRRFRNSATPVEVGRKLGVAAVLTWRLERAEDSLRLRVELVNVRDGRRLAGAEERVATPTMMDLIGRLAVQAARGMGLDATTLDTLDSHPATQGTAFELYLRGQYLLGKRDTSSIREARDRFAEAIERDPAYADAWVGLGYAYGLAAHAGWLPSEQAFAYAADAARRALALHRSSAMARILLAHQTGFRYREWTQSERELREAEAIDPSNADVENAIGLHYRVLGEFDSAAAAMGRAHALEPLARHYAFQKGLVLLCAGRYQQSLEALSQALLVSSAYTAAHVAAAAALAGLGRFDEALTEQRAALVAEGDTALADLASGRRGKAGYTKLIQAVAQVRLQRLEAASLERFVPPAALADAYAAAGDYERALTWLDRAERERDVFITKAGCNRDYDPIRSNARFRDIMRRVGLPADPRRRIDSN